MRRVLWLLPLLAVAGCKEETPRGAVKVTVTYEGFKPRCVRVLARDVSSGQELSEPVQGKGEATGGSLVIAVLPQEDWGTQVEVKAVAFERADCTGKEVVSRSASVTLTPGTASPVTLALSATDGDGDGYVSILTGGTDCRDDRASAFPEAPELCNDVDDNCNDQSDAVELRLGQSCTTAQNCQGTTQCGAGGATICSIPTGTTAYPDDDEDGRGRKDAESTVFCNGVPARFTTGPADDCNDNSASVRPGAMERCNGTDDNCDGQQDEGFPVAGSACSDSTTQCTGAYACDTVSGTAVCQVTQAPTGWFLDEDGDTYGGGAAVQSCVSPGAGYVSLGGDCNDGNPFTHPGAQELCDQEDNNCDMQVEAASVCSNASPTWTPVAALSNTAPWTAVTVWGNGGVWMVGENNRRAVRAPGSSTFRYMADTNCEGDWFSVWVDPSNGRAYMGSGGGRLGLHELAATSCSIPTDIDLWVHGLLGLPTGSGLEFHGAVSNNILTAGQAILWNGATGVSGLATNNVAMFDIHGLSREVLFAVGGGIDLPRIYRFNPSASQWAAESLQGITGASLLEGIWVVSPRLAYAVGWAGTVLRWDGTTWSKMIFPNTEDLSSVLAFGNSSVYVTSRDGSIYRYNGQSWQRVYQDPASSEFYDIAGAHPGDIWAVGQNGVVVHWPQ